MNPYQSLYGPQNDVAEHAHELADGMAIAYRSRLPRYSREAQAQRWQALDEHRRLRAELRAQLAAEQETAA